MQAPYRNLAYARLNIDYDRELFAEEYDREILSRSNYISNHYNTYTMTSQINRQWGMVDPKIYDNYVEENKNNSEKFNSKTGSVFCWKMSQLLEMIPSEHTHPEVLAIAPQAGTGLRNQGLFEKYKFKKEFENLAIAKFIKQLPLTDLITIHCVSLEPGQFAPIHKDVRNKTSLPSYNLSNGIYRRGFVVLTMNISSGGSPLYWGLDSVDNYKMYTADDPCYLISDYFFHGVGITSSRRRQIRVCGKPTAELAQLIDANSTVKIAEDYQFDDPEIQDPSRIELIS